ncbi:hypothetical protein ABFP60_00035 [Clostridioides difficile]
MIKRCIILSIFIVIFFIPIKASSYAPIKSDIYKQGIYNIEGLKEYTVSVELKTNTKTAALLIDENNEVLAYIKLPYNEKITLSNMGNEGIIGIVGVGEVAITYEKIN